MTSRNTDIISVTAYGNIITGNMIQYDILVKGSPTQIQFKNNMGETYTFIKGSNVDSITAAGENEIWHVSRKIFAGETYYTLRVKYSGMEGFREPAFNSILVTEVRLPTRIQIQM